MDEWHANYFNVRARTEISLHLWVSRRPPGKARGMRITRYLIDEQRRRAGCIGVQKWEVISTRGLNVRSVLDVGCAEGLAARFFQSHGCRVDGSQRTLQDSKIP